VDLGLTHVDGSKPGQIPSDKWQGEGYDVSPVYIYKKSYYSQFDSQHIDIGVPTDKGTIYVLNGEVKGKVFVQYVKDNQLLSDIGFYDAIRKEDGETLLIYGQQALKDFKIGGILIKMVADKINIDINAALL
jgi:hypothetical protein